jgi:cell division transport system ATP-binding protein
MITFEKVYKSYGHKNSVLRDINLHIKPGEFVSIVGQSGAGKTTLARILIGEERVDSGRVLVGDWDITRISRGDVPFLRRQIGIIFQDFKLLPKKTLSENIAFALEACGASNAKIKKIVPSVLKIVGLEDKGGRYPQEVSGGEKQRAAIARALVHQPKILLADEPTGNLDAINANEIINLLLKINQFGTTVILVTHNKEVVNQLHHRVITMDHGVIISDKERGKYFL